MHTCSHSCCNNPCFSSWTAIIADWTREIWHHPLFNSSTRLQFYNLILAFPLEAVAGSLQAHSKDSLLTWMQVLIKGWQARPGSACVFGIGAGLCNGIALLRYYPVFCWSESKVTLVRKHLVSVIPIPRHLQSGTSCHVRPRTRRDS